MAAPDWNAEIARYLNLGANPDAKLGTLLAQLGSAVALAFETATASAVDTMRAAEYYDGNGKRHLYLRGFPVIDIESVTLNGDALTVGARNAALTYPPPDVIVPGINLRDRDHLERTGYTTWYLGYRNVGVTYTYGWQSEPGLVQALAKWAAQIFRDRDRLGISSQTMQGQSTTYTRDVPDDVKNMLLPYYRGWTPAP